MGLGKLEKTVWKFGKEGPKERERKNRKKPVKLLIAGKKEGPKGKAIRTGGCGGGGGVR